MRRLRKHQRPSQGRLRDLNGNLVLSDERAKTLAAHLESCQWAVRPDAIPSEKEPIFPELDVNLGRIQKEEVRNAIKQMKKGKAPGDDNIPPEYFKALAKTQDGLDIIVELCPLCWQLQRTPDQWHLAKVSALFKKGDPASCDNYRPISLLSVGYKLLASILLQRLKNASAESRIWTTQYGFKSKSGTCDALLVTRRLLDYTWASSNASAIFLALDWAKAFDSICPASLSKALLRFGIPAEFVAMVDSIYENRRFYVAEAFQKSSVHLQHFGISQGCPLSPFLLSS